MIVRLKHVKRVRAKGRTYWYHRITGERLPEEREERAARVLEINRTMKGTARKITAGSLADVIAQYKQAPEFRKLRDRTRHDYAIYLDLLSEKWGSHPVASIERKHILALRDKYAETAAKANKLVTVLRIVLAFAIDRFLETAPPMMVLAMKLGLYTGQREGDVLAMSWHDYDGERIKVVQAKTGTKLSIRAHAALREALDGQDRVSPIILTTSTKRPFMGSNFRHHFHKAMKDAGLVGLCFHGLRYAAASNLFEVGCNSKEVASVTGHKSLAMVAKYGEAANQERLADAAILRWENAPRTKNGKPR